MIRQDREPGEVGTWVLEEGATYNFFERGRVVDVEGFAGGGGDPFGVDVAFLLEEIWTLERREGFGGHVGWFGGMCSWEGLGFRCSTGGRKLGKVDGKFWLTGMDSF